MSVSNTVEVKQLNRERIREALQQREKHTKADIAKATKLSVATCNTILNEMLEIGEVVKIDQTGAAVGRPADLFTYNKDYQHVLGLRADNVQGQNTVGYAVADALGDIIRQETLHPDEITYEVLEALIAGILAEDENVKAIGFGIPGVADDGVIEYCDIKTLEHVTFSDNIQKRFGIPAIVENDMNFVTYHMYDKLPDKQGDLAAIYFPETKTGWVGCGFVVGGRILKGSSMFSGELSYAVEAFGISKERQQDIFTDRDAFHTFASQILLMVITTLNPSHAVIIGNDVAQEDIDVIWEKCHKFVSRRHIPEIKADVYTPMNYIGGLIRFTLDTLQYPISI